MHKLSRREFLKVSLLGAAVAPFTIAALPAAAPLTTDLLPPSPGRPIGLGRVAIEQVEVYPEPSFYKKRIGWRYRDQTIPIYEEILSHYGPPHNPKWYKMYTGYIHSAHIQRVDHQHRNLPLETIPGERILGEVTVAYAQTMRYVRMEGWQKLYRIYYGSQHWITSVDEGPDGQPW